MIWNVQSIRFESADAISAAPSPISRSASSAQQLIFDESVVFSGFNRMLPLIVVLRTKKERCNRNKRKYAAKLAEDAGKINGQLLYRSPCVPQCQPRRCYGMRTLKISGPSLVPDLLSKMVAHDLATKCKLLEEQSKVREIELNRLATISGRFQGEAEGVAELQKDLQAKDMEIQTLLRANDSFKSEVERTSRSLESVQAELESERKQKLETEKRAADYKRLLEDSERAHSHATLELLSKSEALERIEKNLNDEKRVREQTASELHKASESLRKLQSELNATSNEVEKLKLEKNNLELENTTLSSMIEEIEKTRKEGSAGESGGSGGWSDFGDDIVGEVDDEKERTPASSTVTIPVAVVGSDVREAAKLRAQLKKYEQELETIRIALEHEKEERSRVESKLSSLQDEVEKKRKEVEDRERDRSRADERCNELLAIMKENNTKIRETESLRDKLQENLAKQQAELSSIYEEKRVKDEKIQELEAELKRVRNEHLKLETKRFNEVLDLKHRLDAMQTNHPFTQPVPPYDLLNQSASSAERDTMTPHTLLWEEAPRALSRNCATSPEDDFSHETSPFTKKGSSRGRRSGPSYDHPQGDKRREKKESSHRRVRSRSHGRQLWSSGVLEQSPPFTERSCSSHEFDGNSLNRRHGRNNYIYYSSGGSNGGRSPPPEIPLLSAVPPPGVKKPMGKRVVDADFEIKSS
ncbi:hypothetical protein Y032_0714g1757 [Ancylostoma ceylanicum]|uniref:Uncharacterized protein n=2 Tax=Ancylostoma ceylanicum TaxID=53326 RepID=A0A016WF86_9BILA|nr:hypothetical protein Y032_0714g1757 [Ancylostoma ceylanicum]